MTSPPPPEATGSITAMAAVPTAPLPVATARPLGLGRVLWMRSRHTVRLLREVRAYGSAGGAWWLLPLVVVLVVFALALTTTTTALPFAVYTLF